jgi:hypothetical protein
MFSLSATGPEAPTRVFLWEVTIQCQIALHAHRRLAEYAKVQIERTFESTAPRPTTPIELLADCSAFLSASAVVSRCLFAKGGFAGRRSAKLRKLLSIESLPHLNSLAVRNSFEHIDERIDKLIQYPPSEAVVQLHLALREPEHHLVLKRFNPKTITLHYLDEKLDINCCAEELNQVLSKVVELPRGGTSLRDDSKP